MSEQDMPQNSAKLVVQIEGRTFLADNAESEPRIRDIELGEWLGFERPRKVRELIRRLEQRGDLSGLVMRPHVGRIQKPGKNGSVGIEERVVNEYLLTEGEVLFIAAKSDTPKANEILLDMIRVYRLVRASLQSNAPPKVLQTPEEFIRDLHANAARLGDNPMWVLEFRRRFASCAIVQGVSTKRIEGHCRKHFGVTSYLMINSLQLDELRRVCDDLFMLNAFVKPRKGERLHVKQMERTDKQLKLFDLN